MLSWSRLQPAAATGRICQAQEGASCPSCLVTICIDVAFTVGRAVLGVYLQVHSIGYWEKGPGTLWESPEELWVVRCGGLGHGVPGSQPRVGQYVIIQSHF